MDEVGCLGTENFLIDCDYTTEHDCQHFEDAGVSCSNNGDLRLQDGNATAGRVEIFLDGQWGTVCDDRWDIDDAHVVCRQLGFSRASNAFGLPFFSEGTGIIHLDEVGCLGTENFLIDCDYTTEHDCQHFEDAGVSCSNNGDLRLQDGNATAGRVEIFFDGEWGTVCDDFWDIDDAHVVCRQLGFLSATEVFVSAFFSEGTGNIHLDDVKCIGTETFLIDCNYTTNHDCGHSEDAGVSCLSAGM